MTCCRRAPTSPGCSAPHSLAFLWCCSHSFTALSPLALLLCLKRISNIVEACVHTDSQSRAQQPAASTCMPCASTIALWMRLCSICELYGCQLPTQRCFFVLEWSIPLMATALLQRLQMAHLQQHRCCSFIDSGNRRYSHLCYQLLRSFGCFRHPRALFLALVDV